MIPWGTPNSLHTHHRIMIFFGRMQKIMQKYAKLKWKKKKPYQMIKKIKIFVHSLHSKQPFHINDKTHTERLLRLWQINFGLRQNRITYKYTYVAKSVSCFSRTGTEIRSHIGELEWLVQLWPVGPQTRSRMKLWVFILAPCCLFWQQILFGNWPNIVQGVYSSKKRIEIAWIWTAERE